MSSRKAMICCAYLRWFRQTWWRRHALWWWLAMISRDVWEALPLRAPTIFVSMIWWSFDAWIRRGEMMMIFERACHDDDFACDGEDTAKKMIIISARLPSRIISRRAAAFASILRRLLAGCGARRRRPWCKSRRWCSNDGRWWYADARAISPHRRHANLRLRDTDIA